MTTVDEGTLPTLWDRRLSRRAFLSFCAAMTAVLALPQEYVPRVAAAVEAAPRMPVIWLRGLGCGGDTEAFLRAADPSIAELLMDVLSVDYHQGLMLSSGAASTAAMAATMQQHPNGYLAIVEGAVPTADAGVHLTIGGRAFADVVREVCGGAVATIAVGSCAVDGGLPGAAGGATQSRGLGQVVQTPRLVNLPGCPVNVENLTATIVHYLTFKELPPTDGRGRPLFAYGALIHNQCGRRAHFEFGEFVQAWGDEGAQKGWCLYKMGCKGPESFANCASVRYASGTSWPVRAGAACIACTTPGFWDAMSPFSRRLPSPIPVMPELTVDQAGLALVGGLGALVTAHGAATITRAQVGRARADRARRRGPSGEPPAASDETAVASATTSPEAGERGAAAPESAAVAETTVESAPAAAVAIAPAAEPAPAAAPGAAPQDAGEASAPAKAPDSTAAEAGDPTARHDIGDAAGTGE